MMPFLLYFYLLQDNCAKFQEAYGAAEWENNQLQKSYTGIYTNVTAWPPQVNSFSYIKFKSTRKCIGDLLGFF